MTGGKSLISKVRIVNFKCINGVFDLELNNGLNVIVGNNNEGKSTVLEAIHLALTGIFRGKLLRNNLTQYLFNNEIIAEYLAKLKEDTTVELPKILIELYLHDLNPELEGDLFSDKNYESRTSGIGLEVAFDEKYRNEYNELISSEDINSLPIEYYDVNWYSFSRKPLTTRSVPIKSSFIDVGFSKFWNGNDIYISRIIHDLLETGEKVAVAQAFRSAKDNFSNDKSISNINEKLTGISKLSKKEIELTVDLSAKASWDGSLITLVDKVPFDFIGKGEQAIIKTELALSNKKAEASSVIIIEEPESHISHSRLNQLLQDIKQNYGDKQILISTHSSFVANKLGLDNLILLNQLKTIRFDDLKSKEFFEKIAGYDTLRLILCNKAILVEGDSDELIIQRAYMDKNQGRLPIEDNVEVISVGTSFLRFLEIAEKLDIPVSVVTDNDGDIEAVEKKYSNYINKNKKENIEIYYDKNVERGNLKIGNSNKPFNYNTLEPILLEYNSLDLFNGIFGKDCKNEEEMHIYMKNNKTGCALKIFSSNEKITYPNYILEAIE